MDGIGLAGIVKDEYDEMRLDGMVCQREKEDCMGWDVNVLDKKRRNKTS